MTKPFQHNVTAVLVAFALAISIVAFVAALNHLENFTHEPAQVVHPGRR